jgi:hypothetical protein
MALELFGLHGSSSLTMDPGWLQPQDLRVLMRDLYCTGAKRDVFDIIRTLRTWRGEDHWGYA